MFPICTSSTRPLYVRETFVSSPSISSFVRVIVSPSFNITFFPSFKTPVRISGPFVSKRIATGFFSSSRIFFNMSIRPFCSSCEPCEKLNLAISMPSFTSCLMIFSSFEFGPIVQTILVFFIPVLLLLFNF